MRYWILHFVIFLNLAWAPLHAQLKSAEDLWAAYDGKILIGFELELIPVEFYPLFSMIDLDASGLKSKMLEKVTKEDLNTYLDPNPRAYENFPEAIRKQLTEGLRLNVPRLIRESPEQDQESAKVLPILGPDGRVFSSVIQSLSFQTPQERLSPVEEEEELAKMGHILLTPETELQILKQRWIELPLEVQRSLVDISGLSYETRMHLFFKSLPQKENLPIVLRNSIDSEMKGILDRLVWMKESEHVMELISRTPYSSVSEFIFDRNYILNRIGKLGKIGDRSEPASGTSVSYHYHLSVPGADLRRRAEALNKLLLAEGLSAGFPVELLTAVSDVSYRDVNEKGLLRLVANDRIEFRFHPSDPDQALARYLRWLTMDEEAALQEINQEAQHLIKSEDYTKIIIHAPQAARALIPEEMIIQDIRTRAATGEKLDRDLVALIPNTESLLRALETRENSIRFLANKYPIALRYYFEDEESRAVLTPQEIEKVAQAEPRVLHGLYSMEELQDHLSKESFESLWRLVRTSRGAFTNEDLQRYVRQEGASKIISIDPVILHRIFNNPRELAKVLTEDELASAFFSEEFVGRFFISSRQDISRYSWKRLSRNNLQLAYKIFKDMISRIDDAHPAWIEILHQAASHPGNTGDYLNILRLRDALIFSALIGENKSPQKRRDAERFVTHISRWSLDRQKELLRLGENYFDFLVEEAIQREIPQEIEAIMKSWHLAELPEERRRSYQRRLYDAKKRGESCAGILKSLEEELKSDPTPEQL